MLLIRIIKFFIFIFFITFSLVFKLHAVDADRWIDKNYCKPGMTVNINLGLVGLNQISLLMLPAFGSSEIIPYGGGSYKITEIKGEYAKLEGNHRGWLRVNKQVGWEGSVGKLSLNKVCAEQAKSSYSTSQTIPIKYDASSIFSLNADIGNNFYIIEDGTQQVENTSTQYQKNLLKKAYFVAVTDFYSNNLPFASYGMILTSNKSPIVDSEIDGAFEGLKTDLNISSLPINTTEFIDNEISYHFKEFRYHQKDLWEWLTGSTDTEYFNNFNNCFSSVFHDKPRNNKTITFFATYTSCHKDKLSKKEIGNILKSIYIKDYKTPTFFYDYKSVAQSSESYQVNNKNLYCRNIQNKRVYETSRSSCVGRDVPITKKEYEVLLASQNIKETTNDRFAIVKSADIKFKRVPSISSKTLGYLSINQTLEILPRDPVKDTIGSYWINVIDPKSGKKGWVQDRYLDMSNETYLVNNQNNQKNSFNNKKENYLYCLNNNNEITTRYSTQLKEKCPAGSSKTSELAWINYESQKNNKSDPVNVDLIFDISEIKIVNANPLNIRETPNGKWKSILSRGEKVAIIEENSDKSWNKIVSEDGQMGWVSSKYLVDDLSNIASNEEINSKEILIQEEIVQNQEPEINVAKKTFDEIEPTISCSKNEIYTKEKTALIDCKITDNNEVYKVFINGNEIQLKANRIKEKFPVVIGKSQLELLVFDKAGNETKELISVEREFSFVSQIKEFEPLQPGLISSPINKNRIAIIVGIKDYKDIPDTKYADKDAFTFIDYANETLGINSSNIKYFINDSAGFLDFKTIDKWLSTKINKNTEVFVFYSGHGANNNGQSLLLPSDFRTDLIDDSSITKEGFLQQIADQNPKHIFAFFDACFSGLSREGETLIAGLRNISIVEEEVPFSNITIFNSASGAEFSSDFDEVGHGLFSYYLMKGLEGEADNNSDQQISTSELYDYIYANVSEQSINLGPQQNPSLITNDDQIIVKW